MEVAMVGEAGDVMGVEASEKTILNFYAVNDR